jgi:hypothetical protein
VEGLLFGRIFVALCLIEIELYTKSARVLNLRKVYPSQVSYLRRPNAAR